MITFSKISDSILENGNRLFKVLQFGAKTADESAPFGIDSVPLKNMTAIFADTSNSSESVVIGYINENQLANIGEVRLYSLDENKSLKSFIWLKNDNTIEFNGNTYSMVRFEPLKQGLQNTDLAINTELSKIATAINGIVPGAYVPTLIQTDIDLAKNEDLKTS